MKLIPGALHLKELQAIRAGGLSIEIDPSAQAAIAASAAVVARAAAGSAPVYGVNTGFGKLASTRISESDLATLQLNLIRSHSVGVGEPLPPAVVRLMLALKAASLARGFSGVRPVVIDTPPAWIACSSSRCNAPGLSFMGEGGGKAFATD